MSVPMLITRPKISSVRGIEEVLFAETHSQDDVKRFKILVRMGYLKYLDWSIPYENQKSKKIDRLKQYESEKNCRRGGKMMALEARLRNHKQRKPRTASEMQVCEKITTTTNALGSGKSWNVTFVGKPPPHTRGFPLRDVQEKEVTPGVEAVIKSTQIAHASLPIARSTAVATLPSASSLLNPKLSQTREVMGPPPDAETPDLKYYPSPCAYCGYLPEIPSEIRLALCGLFSAVPHVVPILARNGLVHNRHLEALLAWDRADRQEFCDRLPRNSFSALDIAVITDLLVNVPYPESTSPTPDHAVAGRATEEELESVPWPDTATKTLLMTSSNFVSNLQRAMKLDRNEALFVRIIDLSEQYGKQFLQNYRPFDQASYQRLRKTVHVISEEEPKLQRYEDAWPVRFYLQRRVGDLTRGSVTVTPPQALAALSATSSTQDMVDPLLIITHSGCPVHLPLDTSQASQVVKDFFNNHGMQELVGPLAAIGVVTENQFALFRSLTAEQRENLVMYTDHDVKPFLNLFQCMLLKIALRP